jgi:hypothetical protein
VLLRFIDGFAAFKPDKLHLPDDENGNRGMICAALTIKVM